MAGPKVPKQRREIARNAMNQQEIAERATRRLDRPAYLPGDPPRPYPSEDEPEPEPEAKSKPKAKPKPAPEPEPEREGFAWKYPAPFVSREAYEETGREARTLDEHRQSAMTAADDQRVLEQTMEGLWKKGAARSAEALGSAAAAGGAATYLEGLDTSYLDQGGKGWQARTAAGATAAAFVPAFLMNYLGDSAEPYIYMINRSNPRPLNPDDFAAKQRGIGAGWSPREGKKVDPLQELREDPDLREGLYAARIISTKTYAATAPIER